MNRPLATMTLSDVQTLKHLTGHRDPDYAAKPGHIGYNIGMTGDAVSNRLRYFEEIGLIDCVDTSKRYYRVTELGRQLMEGELSDEETARLEEEHAAIKAEAEDGDA